MTSDEQNQFDLLKQEVETLKSLFYKNNFSDLQVFTKRAQFNGNIGFYKTNPVAQQAAITAPTGGSTIDSQSRTAIAALILAIKTLGLTK